MHEARNARSMRVSLLAVVTAASMLAVAFAGVAGAEHGRSGDRATISFDHKTGNEWWVEVIVEPEASVTTIDKVEASDDDARWHELTLRDWGAWGGSFHIEPGNRVLFRALVDGSTTIYSCWFTHPEGVEQCDEGTPPPDDGSDVASFRHEGGNEWWVEVDVQASPPPDEVRARDTNGDWRTLTYRDWGVWAGSFHIEPGHEVQFRAVAYGNMANVYDVTSCWYTHPAGEPRCDDGDEGEDPPPSGDFDATFRDAGGNEWWVSTYVDANDFLAGVDARIVGEATWHELVKRSWGAWAASFHVEDGERIEFRARSTDGEVDLSEHVYVWPEGTEEARESDARTWPRDGSYVVYEVAQEFRGGDYQRLNVTLTYKDQRWEALCEGHSSNEGDVQPVRYRKILEPVYGPTNVSVGESVSVMGLEPCHHDRHPVDVTGEDTEQARKNGNPVTVPTWRGQASADCNCMGWKAEWHRETGLTMWWWFGGTVSSNEGRLLDTDAPIAEGDAPLPSPERTGWPFEGSFAEFTFDRWDNESADWRPETHATMRYEFRDGAWQVTCTGWSTANQGGDRRTFDHTGSGVPPMAPVRVEAGDRVAPTATGCYGGVPFVVVKGQFPERTTRNGEPHTATVWWGDESDAEDAEGVDKDAWWDVETRLVLRWEWRQTDGEVGLGELTNTDAPLSSG